MLLTYIKQEYCKYCTDFPESCKCKEGEKKLDKNGYCHHYCSQYNECNEHAEGSFTDCRICDEAVKDKYGMTKSGMSSR